MYKAYQKDNLKLYVGVVDAEPERFERNGSLAMVVTLRDYQGERIKIYFNNGAPGSPKADMRADRIVNAKVREGAFLTVLASTNDVEEKTATGLDFKYRGRWTFKGENGKSTTVLMGVATKPRSPKEGLFSITIPVDVYKDGKTSTMWCDVTFFDSDREGVARNNAAMASKVMFNEEKPWVVVTGGEIRDNEYNGRTYHGMVGYRITKKPE